MTKDNVTIRFAPDGFSFIDCPDATSAQFDEAPFHEVSPGPDFQQRLHEAVLEALPESEAPLDLTVQIHSSRVVVLPPDTEFELAASMYRTTFTEAPEAEQVLLQPLMLPSGQQVTLCFGIDRSLYLFLERNFGELHFEHHLATLLLEGARATSGNTLVVRTDEQFLQVALFRLGQLALVNVYRTSQADNRRYYVLNTWIREGLDQLNDHLLILGKGNPASQLHQDLRPFIKQTLLQY
ncbi:MAG: DUF3822 family protein [Bacteroidales bacterium]|nr:DUF3822 family protein [Bacteroidales bacterium]